MSEYTAWFEQLSKKDVPVAGGKGANLGEMTQAGLPVPPGFVITAAAYRDFLDFSGLRRTVDEQLAAINVEDSHALDEGAAAIQRAISGGTVPPAVAEALIDAYRELCRREGGPLRVAVRSSATMEDTEQASFAGMNRSYLNVCGEEQLLQRVRDVWASLFSPRVIFYRRRLQLPGEPEIAVIVQKMVDSAKSGVAFSVDPVSGAPDTIVIEAAPGLGEVVVQGTVEPDRYAVAKTDLDIRDVHIGHKAVMLVRDERGENVEVTLPPERADARVLSDDEVRRVAELVRRDETHYGVAQDTEWAIEDGHTYLVQSRPITTGPQAAPQPAAAAPSTQRELVRGQGASTGQAAGRVRVLRTIEEGDALQTGDVLVAPMTSPDWVPVMRHAAAIVTESGGTTSHAAIVSRELGVPCIVGARRATEVLTDGLIVTVDATSGVVLEGERAPAPAATTP